MRVHQKSFVAGIRAALAALALAIAVGVLFHAAGCSGQGLPPPAELQQDLQTAKQAESQLRETLTDLKAQAATQPADSPTAAKLQTTISAVQKRLDYFEQKVIPVMEAAVKSYSTGTPDPSLTGALSAFGPWGTVAGIAIIGGFGLYQTIRKNQATEALRQLKNEQKQAEETPLEEVTPA